MALIFVSPMKRRILETVDEFVRVVNNAMSGGGKVLVPTLAVGSGSQLLGAPHHLSTCSASHRRLLDPGYCYDREGRPRADVLK
jgi:hypothetical protein